MSILALSSLPTFALALHASPPLSLCYPCLSCPLFLSKADLEKDVHIPNDSELAELSNQLVSEKKEEER